jgi:hypothetical protein
MPNACGKAVYSWRMKLGKARAWLSPKRALATRRIARCGVQVPFPHSLSESYTAYLSPPKLAILPLIEHYLYPVSTAPIINPNHGKLKER